MEMIPNNSSVKALNDKINVALVYFLKSRDNFKMQMFKIRGKQMQNMVV